MTLIDLTPYFDVIDISPEDWPVTCSIAAPNALAMDRWRDYPAAAMPQAGRLGSACRVDAQNAGLAAIGEAIELVSLCAWGDEEILTADHVNESTDAYQPKELCGFSQDQIAQRVRWNQDLDGIDNIPSNDLLEAAREWVGATDAATGNEILLPAGLTFLNFSELSQVAQSYPVDSNGCAAGSNPEQAQLNALLEAIERDAAGRWWYAQRIRPTVKPHELGEVSLLYEKLYAFGLRPTLFDITTDLDVPTIAAIGIVGEDDVAAGFAAGLSVSDAAQSALTEMAQMALKIEGARATGRASAALTRWILEVSPNVPPLTSTLQPINEPVPPVSNMQSVLDRCAERQIRIAFFDHTRSDLALSVWRCVSPDLCHWKPRLGRPRLFEPDSRDLAQCKSPNPVLLRI